ncbi:MAG: DUF4198 domain-containing protein [Burkholderiales bacterium]|nr:DUF4198 domain-containing protein [Burkholderiales bacterium]
MTSRLTAALSAVPLALAAMGAQAHDSWLSPSRNAAPPGVAAVEATTGTRYPVPDVNPTFGALIRPNCNDGRGRVLALKPFNDQPRWLELRATALSRTEPALSCWSEIKAFDIELQPAIVQIYLDEIRASAAQRAAWADLQARGKPWLESYRKLMRIELAAAASATPAQRAATRKPVGMDLELVVLGDAAVAVGQPLEFQLLRDGKPLPNFPLELISERSKIGIWRDTDSEGKVRHTLPFPGNWLLRGTDLRLSAQKPDFWESRFVTLAVEVVPARQP